MTTLENIGMEKVIEKKEIKNDNNNNIDRIKYIFYTY